MRLRRQVGRTFWLSPRVVVVGIAIVAIGILVTAIFPVRPARAQALNVDVAGQETETNAPAATADTSRVNASRLTQDRWKDSAWWPTKQDRSRDEYVGAEACAECHGSIVGTARKSAMAQAATPAERAESLQQLPLGFEVGRYRYEIDDVRGQRGSGKVLKVSHSADSQSRLHQSQSRSRSQTQSQSNDLLWAFGMGRLAQTYIYERNGSFYESHVSFFTSLQALDVTPGHPRTAPPNLRESAGREMTAEETRRCFGCHTTASSSKNQLNAKTLFPGVGCEACHGPGARHVAAMNEGEHDLGVSAITNPARFSPSESVEFCGACHRTTQDVIADGPKRIGTLNVRFQPYRLQNSRCWRKGDARITCVACHDPHRPLERDPAAYDTNCLQCHDAAGGADHKDAAQTSAPKADANPTPQETTTADRENRTACAVGVKLCVTCHMPKFTNPLLHGTFTDHWIRIAEKGSPLPD